MNIICESCQSKFAIDAGKIPAGRTATLQCPRCKNKIIVTAPKSESDSGPRIKTASAEPKAFPANDENQSAFDFDDGKKALVCEQNPEIKSRILQTLEAMEYRTHTSENTRDAIKRMRFGNYAMVIFNDEFDTRDPDSNGVHTYLEQLDITRRRNMFVVMISRRFRTMDHMMSFNKSVNMMINPANINEFTKILEGGITRNEIFYKVFRDCRRKAGKV